MSNTTDPLEINFFFQWILHDWDDNKCLKILENCYNALPNNGKVIVVEQLVPEFPETDIVSKIVVELDLGMLLVSPGAKERTKKEYETLGVGAGFATVKFVCSTCGFWIIEFHK